VDVDAGAARSSYGDVRWSGQAAFAPPAQAGTRLALSWFDPGDGSGPRRRVELAAEQAVGREVTLRESVAFGNLEAFSTSLNLEAGDEPAAPDPGTRVRIEAEWRPKASWSIVAGSVWLQRGEGEGFERPDSSWQADVAVSWDPGEVWEIKGRLVQKRDISGGKGRSA